MVEREGIYMNEEFVPSADDEYRLGKRNAHLILIVCREIGVRQGDRGQVTATAKSCEAEDRMGARSDGGWRGGAREGWSRWKVV